MFWNDKKMDLLDWNFNAHNIGDDFGGGYFKLELTFPERGIDFKYIPYGPIPYPEVQE
jgi:hypothetical protein